MKNIKCHKVVISFVALFLSLVINTQAQPCIGTTSFTEDTPSAGGGYLPGTVVTYCVTVDDFDPLGGNWFEGFDINLGPGWLPGSITPLTIPTDLNAGWAGLTGQWLWIPNPFNANANSLGPGFFFDYNNNGITEDDWGDQGPGPWTMCFSATVGNTPGASLSVEVLPSSDGAITNGYPSGLCDCVPAPCPGVTLPPYNNIGTGNNFVIGCNGLLPSITNHVNVMCNGANTGSFGIAVTNGVPPFTFSFQSGAFVPNSTYNNLSAGTYTVIIKDANSCTVPFTTTITQPANPLSVSVTFKNNVGCAGGATGNYRIIGTGGTGPYTYSTDGVNFVPPNNTASFQTNGLTVGTYNVFVLDANGCTATLPIVITEPLPLTASITAQTNAPCSGPGIGNVTITAVGGTPVYQFKIGTSPNQLSGTFNNLAPGTYTVTIKDANNCTTTVPATIIQPSTPTGSVLSQTDVDCFGNSTGIFNFQGANGTAPYTFDLNGSGFGTNPFNGLAAGTYAVTVKEANGCTGTFNATITQPNVLNLSITSQVNINCFGASTGEVTLSATGGVSAYTYTLGALTNTTGIFTGLAAGNHSFDVTDANGCVDNVVANITQPATGIGALIVVQNNVLCTGTNTGSFTLQGNNGNSPYSFTLNGTTNTTGTFNNLSAAIYNVTVTDAMGCTFIQAVNLISPNALSASITNQTAVNCFGGNNASVTVTATSGTNPYTFTLGATSNATGIFNNLSAANYNVIVTDQNGCTFAQPVVIVQPSAALTSSITNQVNVACFGGNTGSVTVLAGNGTASYSYQLGANNNTTGLFGTLTSGIYTVIVTDNNGCTMNQSVNITQPNAALSGLTLNQTAVDCFGNNTGQIQVSGSNGTLPYSYTLGAVNNTNGNFTNLIAGTYNITITDNNACTHIYPIVINQPTAPLTASIVSQTDATCFNGLNGTVTLAAAGGTPNYQYGITGNTLTNNTLISGLGDGVYSLTVRDNNACTVTLNVTIAQPLLPISSVVTSTTDVLCFGNNTGALSVVASNGIAPYNYTVGSNTNTTGNFNGLNASTYTIHITDINGCIASANATINQPAAALLVTIQSATNPVCFGFTNGAATAIAAGGTAIANYAYSWNTVPIQTNAQATNLSVGNYTITVTDDNFCTATANVILTEPNFLLNTATTQTICDGETAHLTATSLDGASPVTYTWTNMNNGSILVGNNVNPTPNSSVNYTVIATDVNGCVTSPTIVALNVNPAPMAAFSIDVNEGCQPLCVTFNASPTLANTSWQWDFGDSQTAIGQNPINCFKEESVYSVTLTAVSDSGCKEVLQKNDLITVYGIPKAIFTAEPEETTLSNPTILVANQSAGADEFEWLFGDGEKSELFDLNHTYTETGNYCIWLIAKNDFGCVDSAKECIKIKPNYTLFVPNSFTPNGDGLNDVFIPLVQSVKEYEMSIYNRWGLKIFSTQQLEVGWDGGNEPQGAFNYVILVTTLSGEQKLYSGSITLYR